MQCKGITSEEFYMKFKRVKAHFGDSSPNPFSKTDITSEDKRKK